MEIKQFRIEEMEHFKRMPIKDNGIRIIFTHRFSQKFENNKFDFILDFLKNTDCDIEKCNIHLIKNDSFFGQCGQDITKNSLALEFDNLNNIEEGLFYATYLAEIYQERFVLYLYAEKIAYYIKYDILDYYPKSLENVMKKFKDLTLKNSFSEIDNALNEDFIILYRNKNSYTDKIMDKTSYGLTNMKCHITILPKKDALDYLKKHNVKTEKEYLWHKADYILIYENDTLKKYDMWFNCIKTYKVNDIKRFIKKAFCKNIVKIEKHEYAGISCKFAPHNIYKTTILYQKTGNS